MIIRFSLMINVVVVYQNIGDLYARGARFLVIIRQITVEGHFISGIRDVCPSKNVLWGFRLTELFTNFLRNDWQAEWRTNRYEMLDTFHIPII